MLFTRWKNERSVREAAAAVVSKREHISRQAYCRTCAVQPSEMTTAYYVTFRLDGGEQIELQVPSDQAVDLIGGDKGMLSFQGTRFLGFKRN